MGAEGGSGEVESAIAYHSSLARQETWMVE